MNRVSRDKKLCLGVYGGGLLAVVLSGCITAPEVEPISFTTQDAGIHSRTTIVAAELALTQEDMPSKWWQLFGDATLIALQAEAAESNLELQAAGIRIEESRAQLGLVNSARKPQVVADAGYSRSAISEHSPMAMLGAPSDARDLWSMGLQAGWELDLWGHLRHLSDSSEANLQANRFGMEVVRVSVAGDVARTYLLLRGVQQQETIVKENRLIAENLVRIAESRMRYGVATRFDAATARADVAVIDARLAQLHHQRKMLMNALALLLGKAPRELDGRLVATSLPPMPQRLPIGIPSELARNRPDILQAEAKLRAAVANIGAAQADFYPRISLTGSLGVQAFDFSDLGSWDSRQFSIGPTLHLPIFQGGRLKSNLELTKVRHRLAGIAYQQTVLHAWHEVDDALDAYAAELQRYEQLQLALTQNQMAMNVAQRSYQQGTADFTSVLIARRSLLSTQAELTDCATASALSVVSLYRSLGGGWSPELQIAATSAGEQS